MPKLSELNGWAENAPGKKEPAFNAGQAIEVSTIKVASTWNSGFNTALSQVSELHEEVDKEALSFVIEKASQSYRGYNVEACPLSIYIACALASTMKDWLRITKPTERAKEDE